MTENPMILNKIEFTCKQIPHDGTYNTLVKSKCTINYMYTGGIWNGSRIYDWWDKLMVDWCDRRCPPVLFGSVGYTLANKL
jgi:hypothetical protein